MLCDFAYTLYGGILVYSEHKSPDTIEYGSKHAFCVFLAQTSTVPYFGNIVSEFCAQSWRPDVQNYLAYIRIITHTVIIA